MAFGYYEQCSLGRKDEYISDHVAAEKGVFGCIKARNMQNTYQIAQKQESIIVKCYKNVK